MKTYGDIPIIIECLNKILDLLHIISMTMSHSKHRKRISLRTSIRTHMNVAGTHPAFSFILYHRYHKGSISSGTQPYSKVKRNLNELIPGLSGSRKHTLILFPVREGEMKNGGSCDTHCKGSVGSVVHK